MCSSDLMHYFKIPKGILLYVNKDTLALKEFLVSYSPGLAGSLMSSLEGLKEKIEINVVPARLLNYPENIQCRYCAFKEICKIAGGVEVGWDSAERDIRCAAFLGRYVLGLGEAFLVEKR